MDSKTYRQFLILGSGLLIFLLLPLLTIAWTALDQNLWENLDPNLWVALKISLQTSVASCLVVILCGTPLAFYFAMHQTKKTVQVLQLICDSPLALPPAVAGLSLLILFSTQGMLGKFFNLLGINIAFSSIAIILAQIFVISPFYIRSCLVGFKELDKNCLDAGRIDGASELQMFFNLVLPLTKTSIISGITLSWLRAIGEFGATAIFAGNVPGISQTVALYIYDSLHINWQSGVALSFVVMLFCWGGLIFIYWIAKFRNN